MRIRLIDYPKDIERGIIIRCKSRYPYEDVVDFLVCESYDSSVGYTLMVISGYKAGLKLVILPQESAPTSNPGFVISGQWLKNNWYKWGYTDCPVEDVWIVKNKQPQL